MQPQDTAYPRFKSRLTPSELERFYTPTEDELAFCVTAARSPTTRMGFVILLKTFQRLAILFCPARFLSPSSNISHSLLGAMPTSKTCTVTINRKPGESMSAQYVAFLM
nr:DUF4158 domain-containing protein [Yersinia ruckeri]